MPNRLASRGPPALLLAALALAALAAVGASALSRRRRRRAPAPAADGRAYEPGVVVVGFARAASVRGDALGDRPRRESRERRTPTPASATVALRRARQRDAGHRAAAPPAPASPGPCPDYIAHAALAAPPPPAPRSRSTIRSYGAHRADLPRAVHARTTPGSAGVPGAGASCSGTSPGPSASTRPRPGRTSLADGHPGGAGVIVAVLDTGVAYADHWPLRPLARLHARASSSRATTSSPTPPTRRTATATARRSRARSPRRPTTASGVTGLAYGVGDAGPRARLRRATAAPRRSRRGSAGPSTTTPRSSTSASSSPPARSRRASIPELIDAIDYAHAHNVLVVAASGQRGRRRSSPTRPRRSGSSSVGATHPGRLPRLLLELRRGSDARRARRRRRRRPARRPALPPERSRRHRHLPGDLRQPRHRRTYRIASAFPAGYFGTSMAAPHVSAPRR